MSAPDGATSGRRPHRSSSEGASEGVLTFHADTTPTCSRNPRSASSSSSSRRWRGSSASNSAVSRTRRTPCSALPLSSKCSSTCRSVAGSWVAIDSMQTRSSRSSPELGWSRGSPRSPGRPPSRGRALARPGPHRRTGRAATIARCPCECGACGPRPSRLVAATRPHVRGTGPGSPSEAARAARRSRSRSGRGGTNRCDSPCRSARSGVLTEDAALVHAPTLAALSLARDRPGDADRRAPDCNPSAIGR